MSKWFYKGKCIKCLDDTPSDKPFMVYKITISPFNTHYFGSKQLYSVRRVKLSKKKSIALYKGKGSYPKYETKRTESDWLSYNSSSKEVQKILSQGYPARFEILGFYETKREMLLQEAYLIIKGFLENDSNLLNGWVSVRANKSTQ